MLRSFFHLLVSALIALLLLAVTSCNESENNSDLYKDWREFNNEWLRQQAVRTNPDGTAYYTRCVMPTDPQSYVLMHNIGEVHTQNFKPLYTSTTSVNYTLTLANDSVVDQGTNFVSTLNSTGYIDGWGLAIMQLHVGDSAQFILPYTMGYGETGSAQIRPYSNLQFNIRLVNIDGYEIRP